MKCAMVKLHMRLGIETNQLECWSQPHVILIDCLYFDADLETVGLVLCKLLRCGCYKYHWEEMGYGASGSLGQFLQDWENGQNVAFFLLFLALLWPNFSTFLNCSEEILPVIFYKCFRYGPSSSRTRARAVWSWWHWGMGMMVMMICSTIISQTSNQIKPFGHSRAQK